MKKISNRGKILISVVSFILITPLLVFYLLEETGVFDTRSHASLELTDEMKKGDLDGNEAVQISDYVTWLTYWRSYKDDGIYTQAGDLDGDSAVALSDFVSWVDLWKRYRTENSSGAEQEEVSSCSSDSLVDATGKTSVSIECGDKITVSVVSKPSTGYSPYPPVYDNTVFELVSQSDTISAAKEGSGSDYLVVVEDPLDLPIMCQEKGGTWNESFNDCDGITEEECTSIPGGTYVEYPDACRDSDDAGMVCAQVVIQTCSFESEILLVGNDREVRTYTFKSLKKTSGSVIDAGIYKSFSPETTKLVQQSVTVTVN